MNKFDERYEIRMAMDRDIDMIMGFIDTYWKKGHILATDRNFFEYEFREGNQVNMVLSIDRTTASLEGIFGFLYCSHTKEMEKRDIWGSLWKVVESHKNEPLLGVELAKRAYQLIGCRMHIGSGANPKTTIPLRRIFFQDKTAKMKQYYCLNPQLENYQICRVGNKTIYPYKKASCLQEIIWLRDMESFREAFCMEELDAYPYKDNWYVEKRFYCHPYYKYFVWGLKEKNIVSAVVVGREVLVGEHRILRIVDYLGNHKLFSETGDFWHTLLQKQGYEYIDFYEFGMEDRILEEAGFVLRKEGDGMIVPNYFEPFIQENVEIWVHYKWDGTTFFKADCDQDRPNIPKGGHENEQYY